MKLVYLFFFVMLLSKSTFAQKVENVRLEVVEDKIVVLYDINQYSNKRLYTVDIKFQSTTEITPFALSGDVGERVLGGKDRKIVWDLYQDIDGLQGNLKAVITIDESKKQFYAGPSAALLSAALPGLALGQWRVRRNKLPAIFTTLAFVGSLAGAALEFNNAWDIYLEEYSEVGVIPASDLDNASRQLEQSYENYLAARKNGETLLMVAGGIYVLDVLTTGINGYLNRKKNPYFSKTQVTTSLAVDRYYNSPIIHAGIALNLN